MHCTEKHEHLKLTQVLGLSFWVLRWKKEKTGNSCK